MPAKIKMWQRSCDCLVTCPVDDELPLSVSARHCCCRCYCCDVCLQVLCSVPNPQQAVSELLRVIKPGGSLLLIEHVVAPSFGLLQLQQRVLDPLQQLLADNCHLTRDTAAVLQASGFECGSNSGDSWVQPLRVQSVEAAAAEVAAGSSGLLSFEVPGMSLIAPHVAGILRKPLEV
jgi:SAM-dependent methyltransferase